MVFFRNDEDGAEGSGGGQSDAHVVPLLPLRDVVNVVVADLSTLDTGVTAASPARDAVYESLRLHYPCDHD